MKPTTSNVVAFPVSVDVRDALDFQIQAAIGIQYAVVGLANGSNIDPTPIWRLLNNHIAALKQVAQELETT
jgi:hypothetical protein